MIGDIITLGSHDFIILDNRGSELLVLSKNTVSVCEFDNNSNNFANSTPRNYLNTEFLTEIQSEEYKLIPFETDLTSLDGLTDYESVENLVSLLTLADYQKYSRVIPRIDNWWWLATPWSTPTRGFSRYVCYVSSNGTVRYSDCGYSGGVRPFCILQSSSVEPRYDISLDDLMNW